MQTASELPVTGLIMAGGRSERMRLTFGPKHKALVPVLGVPMLEWNICALLSRGIRRIVVALSAAEPEIERYVRTRGRTIAGSAGGTVTSLIEAQPLGTIGPIGELQDLGSQVLVTNVDNLTTLNWEEMLAYHQRRGAVMTIAAHWQPFRIPLGELEVSGDSVCKYSEKPFRSVLISSGAYVLDSSICKTIPHGQRLDVPELVKAIIGCGQSVAAFRHNCPWIDVNDADAIADAERLVAANLSTLGCWHPSPSSERLHLLIRSERGVLAEKYSSGSPSDSGWGFPGQFISQPADEAAVSTCRRLGFDQGKPRWLGAYDDLEEHGESITRHFVFLTDVASGAAQPAGAERAWVCLGDLDKLGVVSRAMLRSSMLLKVCNELANHET